MLNLLHSRQLRNCQIDFTATIILEILDSDINIEFFMSSNFIYIFKEGKIGISVYFNDIRLPVVPKHRVTLCLPVFAVPLSRS